MAKKVTLRGNRYVIEVDGRDAGYAAFVERDNVRNFNHTAVDPTYRGQGLSKTLISEALDDTRAAGKKIIPTCSAVVGFVDKNPEYQDLIAE